MTLPIWRDKIAAEIAQAKANELAAKSRLKAAQIDLAVNFAEKSFAYRETSRNLALIENELIPKARQSLGNHPRRLSRRHDGFFQPDRRGTDAAGFATRSC